MGKFEDKTGKVYGDLTVLKRVSNRKQPNGKTQVYWLCQCTCGNTVIVRSTCLNSGNTTSCGCTEHRIKHGMSRSRIYRIWVGIKSRCNNEKHYWYSYYGGRGIQVCDEWKNDFISFYNWAINNGYQDNLSIDRINNNGNYEPTNCRWTTSKEQLENRRNFRIKNQYGTFGLRF